MKIWALAWEKFGIIVFICAEGTKNFSEYVFFKSPRNHPKKYCKVSKFHRVRERDFSFLFYVLGFCWTKVYLAVRINLLVNSGNIKWWSLYTLVFLEKKLKTLVQISETIQINPWRPHDIRFSSVLIMIIWCAVSQNYRYYIQIHVWEICPISPEYKYYFVIIRNTYTSYKYKIKTLMAFINYEYLVPMLTGFWVFCLPPSLLTSLLHKLMIVDIWLTLLPPCLSM